MDVARANELFEMADASGGGRPDAPRRAAGRVPQRPARRGGGERLRPRRGAPGRADLRRLREPQLRRHHRSDGDGEHRLLRAQVQARHRRARDPLTSTRSSATSADKGFELAARVFQTRQGEHASDARGDSSAASASQRFFAVYEMLERRGQVHLDREPLHRRRVRERGPRAGAASTSARPRLRARRPAREQPPIMDYLAPAARRVQRLRRHDEGHRVRPVLPRQAARRSSRPSSRGHRRSIPSCRGCRACPVYCDYHPGQPQVA